MEIPKYLDPEWLRNIKESPNPSCEYFPKDTILIFKISNTAVVYKVKRCIRFADSTINPHIKDYNWRIIVDDIVKKKDNIRIFLNIMIHQGTVPPTINIMMDGEVYLPVIINDVNKEWINVMFAKKKLAFSKILYDENTLNVDIIIKILDEITAKLKSCYVALVLEDYNSTETQTRYNVSSIIAGDQVLVSIDYGNGWCGGYILNKNMDFRIFPSDYLMKVNVQLGGGKKKKSKSKKKKRKSKKKKRKTKRKKHKTKRRKY